MPRTYFKAPKYFVELMKEAEQLQDEVAEIMGTTKHWLLQTNAQAKAELVKRLTDEQRNRAHQLASKGNQAANYAWARIRYEKDDLAENLYYDPEKQIIKIKQNPMTKLIKTVKGVLSA